MKERGVEKREREKLKQKQHRQRGAGERALTKASDERVHSETVKE